MCFENLIFTTFLSPFINTVLSFSNTMNIICVIDSKYNVKMPRTFLVQNKTIHSLNLFALDRIFLPFLKMVNLSHW